MLCSKTFDDIFNKEDKFSDKRRLGKTSIKNIFIRNTRRNIRIEKIRTDLPKGNYSSPINGQKVRFII